MHVDHHEWQWRLGDTTRPAALRREVSYARLYYVDCQWPDFTAQCLQRALGCPIDDERIVSIS